MNKDAKVLTEVARRLAETAEAAMSEHERVVHEGRPCAEKRVSLVAFLAHRLGVMRSVEDQIQFAVDMLELRLAHHDERKARPMGGRNARPN